MLYLPFLALLVSSSFAQAQSPEVIQRLNQIREKKEILQERMKLSQSPELNSEMEELKKEEQKILGETKPSQKVAEKASEVLAASPVQKTKESVAPIAPIAPVAAVMVEKKIKSSPVQKLETKSEVTIDKEKSLQEQYDQILGLLEDEQSRRLDLLEKQGSDDSEKFQRRLDRSNRKLAYLELEKTRAERLLKNEPKPQAPAVAATGDNKFSYRGHFQIRNEGARNTKGVQGDVQKDQAFFRFRTYFKFTPNPKLTFNFTPQATKGYAADTDKGESTSGTTNHNAVTFFEANTQYLIYDKTSVKIGRQELNYGDQLVIGPQPWNNLGRSFDAVKVNYVHDKGWSDVVYSKTYDNKTPTDDTDDSNILIAYNSFDLGQYLRPLDIYFINVEDNRNTKFEVNMAGFRVKGEQGPFFYRTENAVQRGAGLGHSAYQYNLEAGMTFGKNRMSVEYAAAGADYQSLYPTAHRFLGIADVFGRRNIEQVAVHGFREVTSWLTVNMDYHIFKRHQVGKSAYKLNGKDAWGTNGSSNDMGREFDIIVNFKTKDAINLQLGGAWYQSGEYIKDQNSGKGGETRFLYAQVVSEF